MSITEAEVTFTALEIVPQDPLYTQVWDRIRPAIERYILSNILPDSKHILFTPTFVQRSGLSDNAISASFKRISIPEYLALGEEVSAINETTWQEDDFSYGNGTKEDVPSQNLYKGLIIAAKGEKYDDIYTLDDPDKLEYSGCYSMTEGFINYISTLTTSGK